MEETNYHQHYHNHESSANCIQQFQKMYGIELKLTGVMGNLDIQLTITKGKRTKFQTFQTPQLVLEIISKNTSNGNPAVKDSKKEEETSGPKQVNQDHELFLSTPELDPSYKPPEVLLQKLEQALILAISYVFYVFLHSTDSISNKIILIMK